MGSVQSIILYHANCPDGFGAAWAAWKKFGSRAEYIALQHGDPIPEGLSGKEVYIADFSFKEQAMKRLLRSAKKVIALDHHISAEKETMMAHEYVYGLDRSGSVIAWDYFHPKKKIPKLLLHVQDVDLWQFALKNTKEVVAYINSYSFDFEFWSKLARDLNKAKTRAKIVSEGGAILRYQSSVIQRAVKNAALVKFAGKNILAANSSVLKSEIGNALVKKKAPFAVVWSEKEGKVVVSLRASGKYDVAKLSEKYGGGGHKNAAGFTLSVAKKIPWKIVRK